MVDFDKLPPVLQWAALAGAIIAGAVASWLGTRKANTETTMVPSAAHDDRELNKALDELRDTGLRHEFIDLLNDARKGLEEALRATRASFYEGIKKSDEVRVSEQRDLERRLQKMELKTETLERDVADLKRRRR